MLILTPKLQWEEFYGFLSLKEALCFLLWTTKQPPLLLSI